MNDTQTTITLPDSLVRVDATLGVAIVQGDRKPAGEPPQFTFDWLFCGDIDAHHPHHRCPGVTLLAPRVWAQYDKPCETCDQAAERLHDAYERAALSAGWQTQERSRKPWSEVPEANKQTMRVAIREVFGCPDCSDGRQVWAVRWPCPDGMKSPGAGWLPPSDYHNETCTCEGERLLSARATLQVVPVVEGGADADYPFVFLSNTCDDEVTAFLSLDDDDGNAIPLPLDPLPTTDQWVVEIEVVA